MTADGTPGSKNQPQYLGTGAPSTASDMNALANYAAKVGNVRVDTNANRLAATGLDVWEGLQWYDTDEKVLYEYSAGAWAYLGGPEIAGTFTFGGLYSNHASYDSLTLTRRGKRARLRGTATINQTVTFSPSTSYTLGNVPAAFRPASSAQAFRPAAVSPINAGFLVVLSTGDVQFALLNGTTQAANAWILGIDIEWLVP